MTQRDQNQDAQLDDLFAARPMRPSQVTPMQALFDTIPEPMPWLLATADPVSTGWWASVR